MPRQARLVAKNMPHHVMQRGNRRQIVFFDNHDKAFYLDLLERKTQKYHVQVWAYCLMDNHVHIIAVPAEESSLASAIGETHKEYTRMINFRQHWRGYLWEGRFKSFIIDEKYLYTVVRYVERNPVRAKMVNNAEEYVWSSAWCHVRKQRHPVLSDFFLLNDIKNWSDYLKEEDDDQCLSLFRRHGETGKPLGDPKDLMPLAVKYGWNILPKKPGPRKKMN